MRPHTAPTSTIIHAPATTLSFHTVLRSTSAATSATNTTPMSTFMVVDIFSGSCRAELLRTIEPVSFW